MLLELHVRDFAIIDEVRLSFTEGFNVLSGETGAGKSILLKSLGLLMGAKASTDTVRNGATQAIIEGSFDISHRKDILQKLEQLEIPDDEQMLVVRRVISAQGKSRVYLNGEMAALSSLKHIVAPLIEVTGRSAPLIEMTGQHDTRHLQSKGYHLELLDQYAGLGEKNAEYLKLFNEHKDLQKQIDVLKAQSAQREQQIDFLSFQRDEISALNLQPEDEEQLENLVKKQKSASKLSDFARSSEATLYGDEDSALVRLHRVLQLGSDLKDSDSELPQKLEPLAQAKTLIEECVYDLRDYGQGLSLDSESLNRAEDRLSRLRRLQKKYGPQVEDILGHLAKIEEELSLLENFDSELSQLEEKLTATNGELLKLADHIHKKRKGAAEVLDSSVNHELKSLNMKGVIFGVQVEVLENLNSSGGSSVEFQVRSSQNSPFKPISKVASGGELSRILLSLKRVISDSEHPRTYLFDEVDSGVSGETAEKVGKMLRSISKGQQVVCVTHLPQVASFAHTHFFIDKKASKKSVSMQVIALDTKSQVDEIARLLSGEKISSASLENARQMLQKSQKFVSQ